jgi:hypothetical protein
MWRACNFCQFTFFKYTPTNSPPFLYFYLNNIFNYFFSLLNLILRLILSPSSTPKNLIIAIQIISPAKKANQNFNTNPAKSTQIHNFPNKKSHNNHQNFHSKPPDQDKPNNKKMEKRRPSGPFGSDGNEEVEIGDNS